MRIIIAIEEDYSYEAEPVGDESVATLPLPVSAVPPVAEPVTIQKPIAPKLKLPPKPVLHKAVDPELTALFQEYTKTKDHNIIEKILNKTLPDGDTVQNALWKRSKKYFREAGPSIGWNIVWEALETQAKKIDKIRQSSPEHAEQALKDMQINVSYLLEVARNMAFKEQDLTRVEEPGRKQYIAVRTKPLENYMLQAMNRQNIDKDLLKRMDEGPGLHNINEKLEPWEAAYLQYKRSELKDNIDPKTGLPLFDVITGEYASPINAPRYDAVTGKLESPGKTRTFLSFDQLLNDSENTTFSEQKQQLHSLAVSELQKTGRTELDRHQIAALESKFSPKIAQDMLGIWYNSPLFRVKPNGDVYLATSSGQSKASLTTALINLLPPELKAKYTDEHSPYYLTGSMLVPKAHPKNIWDGILQKNKMESTSLDVRPEESGGPVSLEDASWKLQREKAREEPGEEESVPLSMKDAYTQILKDQEGNIEEEGKIEPRLNILTNTPNIKPAFQKIIENLYGINSPPLFKDIEVDSFMKNILRQAAMIFVKNQISKKEDKNLTSSLITSLKKDPDLFESRYSGEVTNIYQMAQIAIKEVMIDAMQYIANDNNYQELQRLVGSKLAAMLVQIIRKAAFVATSRLLAFEA